MASERTNQIPRNWQTDRLAIREATPEDAEACAHAYNSVVRMAIPDPTFAREATVEEILRYIRDPADRGVTMPDPRMQVVFAGARLVGYFRFAHGHPKDGDPHVAWIAMYVFHADFQRQGYGRELLEGLVRECQASGRFRAIELKVFALNPAAVQFWFATGFRTITDIRTGSGHLGLILRREI